MNVLIQDVAKNSLHYIIKKFTIEYTLGKDHTNVLNVEIDIMIEPILNII
jgi:hypothetical protein